MHDNQLTRALQVMSMQLPFAAEPEQKRKIAERTQFFVDRYVDLLIKRGDADSNNVFFAHKFMREVQTQDLGVVDSTQFVAYFCKLAEDKVSKMSPKQLLRTIESFGDKDMQRKMVEATIVALKDQRIDIRGFNSEQLCSFVELVAEHQPKELQVFYKYAETAAGMGLFKEKFGTLARLFCLFVEQGYLQEQTKLFYATMLGLKERVVGDNKIDSSQIINLAWSLVSLDG